jgi:GGDEF domain-containing protein
MVDPITGAGTMAALRRDLALQETSAGMPDGKVVGLEIETLDQFRLVLGSGAADEVIRGLVEVAPFALQARDRVYRFGRDKLILWLGASKDSEVEKARVGLEEAVKRFLADRGFPEVRLLARTLDRAAITR